MVNAHEFFGAECLGSQQVSLWTVVAEGPLTYLYWDRHELLQELENRDVAFVVTTLLNVDAERKVLPFYSSWALWFRQSAKDKPDWSGSRKRADLGSQIHQRAMPLPTRI